MKDKRMLCYKLLSRYFGYLSVLFLFLFAILLTLHGFERGPTESAVNNVKIQDNETYSTEKYAGNTDDLSAKDNLYYRNEIMRNLIQPQIDHLIMSDILYEYREYNKSISDLKIQIDNSFYISKMYITFCEKIEYGSEAAMEIMEWVEKTLDEHEELKTEYELQNLEMLSTIYQMMGIKSVSERFIYYAKASECLEKILDLYAVAGDDIYLKKLSELIDIECELGNKDRALELLDEWYEMELKDNAELYYKYVSMLVKEDGNEEILKDILKRISQINEVKEDIRYEEIVSRIERYIEEE